MSPALHNAYMSLVQTKKDVCARKRTRSRRMWGEGSSGIAGISGGGFDSRTPVYFGCRSSNLILLDLTIALLLRLGTVTDFAVNLNLDLRQMYTV